MSLCLSVTDGVIAPGVVVSVVVQGNWGERYSASSENIQCVFPEWPVSQLLMHRFERHDIKPV